MARKRYFDITQVDGVTPEIIREYKKLVRHERYIEECDRKNGTKKYGFEEEIERFLPEHINQTYDDILSDKMIKFLYEALDELLSVDESCYHTVVDYYFSCEKMSYSILVKKYGVSKQTIHNRIHKAILFLRKTMITAE